MRKINSTALSYGSFALFSAFFAVALYFFGRFLDGSMMYNCYLFQYPIAEEIFFSVIVVLLPVLFYQAKIRKCAWLNKVAPFAEKHIDVLSGGYFILLFAAYSGLLLLFTLVAWKPFEALLFGVLSLSFFYWVLLKIKRNQEMLIPKSISALLRIKDWKFDLLIVCCAILLISWVKKYYFYDMSCISDSNSQMAHALLWKSGQWYLPNPFGYKEIVNIVNGVKGDRVCSQYPPGYISVLYLFAKMNMMHYTGVFIGALTLPLVRILGDRLFKAPVGRIASVFLLASPFFVIMSAESMNHCLGLFLTLAICIFIDKNLKKFQVKYALLIGFLIAFLGITRPLNGVVISVFYALHSIYYHRKRMAFIKDGWYVFLGALPVICFLMLVNYKSMGDPFTLGYKLSDPKMHRLGFAFMGVENYPLTQALKNVTVNILSASQWIFFLPVISLFPLILWWLFLRKTSRQMSFVFLCLMQFSAYGCYHFHDLFIGPRFWYEMLGFPIIFSAAACFFFARKYYRSFSARSKPYILLIIFCYFSMALSYSAIRGNIAHMGKYKIILKRGASLKTLMQNSRVEDHSIIIFGLYLKDWMWIYGPSFSGDVYAAQYDDTFDYQMFQNAYPDWKLYCIYNTKKIEEYDSTINME